MPSNDRAWPQGSSFYHYDKLYDRRDVGYRGPNFAYASMPDQYIFAALQRLELAKPHRRPVFAEVDTGVEPHAVDPHPPLIPWSEVGDGSIFNRIPVDHDDAARSGATPHRAGGYGQSIQYSLNALISFVQHYGDKNLVLVVLGDHQPLRDRQRAAAEPRRADLDHRPRPGGAEADRAGGAGTTACGPSPQAPVWPMSAFRDRFLSAFDSHPRPSSLVVDDAPAVQAAAARPGAAWTASAAWPRCSWW